MAERIAVLFPGQGAQRVGMGADLYEKYEFVRRIYDQADESLGFSLSKLCFEGPIEELTKTNRAQLAILVTSYAVSEVARHNGIFNDHKVAATCGLSLGEYTALVFAESLPFHDALRIVKHRGEFMQNACNIRPSGMVSVIGLKHPEVDELVERAREDGVLLPANYNSPLQVAVSGDIEALERFQRLAKEAGAKRVVPLKVAGAFHSELMDEAARSLAPFIEEVELQRPKVPFLSNVTGDFETDPKRIKENLKLQVNHPVLWSQSIEKILSMGVRTFFELGPGTVLSNLVRRTATDEVRTEAFLSVESLEK